MRASRWDAKTARSLCETTALDSTAVVPMSSSIHSVACTLPLSILAPASDCRSCSGLFAVMADRSQHKPRRDKAQRFHLRCLEAGTNLEYSIRQRDAHAD